MDYTTAASHAQGFGGAFDPVADEQSFENRESTSSGIPVVARVPLPHGSPPRMPPIC